MKKKIETDFWVQDIVRIKPLEKIIGRVIAVWIDIEGIQYKVNYFYNDPKEAYLLPSQLEDA